MRLYNLDDKITNKSYEVLNSHIEDQRQIDTIRVSEIRNQCKDILQRHGIFEDRKNGAIYQAMEKELGNLERNIDYFNEYYFEEFTKSRIDLGIENITSKIDSLEQNIEFVYEDDTNKYNKANSEQNIKNMLYYLVKELDCSLNKKEIHLTLVVRCFSVQVFFCFHLKSISSKLCKNN